jgi:hypothetical protein
VHVRDLPGLGLEALGAEHVRQLPAQRAIEAGHGGAELRLLRVEPDHERVGLDGGQRGNRDGHLHATPPPASAAARLIMSASPSVIGSRSTSSIVTQRTSAASLPAVIVSFDCG